MTRGTRSRDSREGGTKTAHTIADGNAMPYVWHDNALVAEDAGKRPRRVTLKRRPANLGRLPAEPSRGRFYVVGRRKYAGPFQTPAEAIEAARALERARIIRNAKLVERVREPHQAAGC